MGEPRRSAGGTAWSNFVTLDARLLALDAQTARTVWEQTLADWRDGYTATAAPLFVKDKVIAGISGGEYGIRGFLDAFDARTGERAWRFWTIPAPGEPGSETWQNAEDPTWVTGADFRMALGRGTSVYASMGQGFRAPAVIELACADPENPCPLPFALGDDPPLDPVIATTYEMGAQWLRGPLTLDASTYRTEVRDDIFLFPYEEDDEPEGSTIDGFFANIARTRRQGVELDSRLVMRGGHSLFLNYAYTSATFQVNGIELFSIREEAGSENEVDAGDRLPLIPDHTLRAGGLVALPHALSLGFQTRYTGQRWLRGDEANEEEPLDSYWITDLRIGYQLQRWQIQGILYNAFNTSYAAFGTFNLNQGAGGALERFLTPGQPRAFRLAVGRTFGTLPPP